MQGRFSTILIVIFWLATMSWLITTKFLPPLVVGEPPSYASITAAKPTVTEWEIHWNGHPVGQATSRLEELPDDLRELSSHVQIQRLPLHDLAGGLIPGGASERGTISLEAKNSYSIGPLGNLIGLRSEIQVQPLLDRIQVQGHIEGQHLVLEINTGDFQYTTQAHLPRGGLVSDALSPQMRLPGVKLGQTWTEPVYSPFGSSSDALDVLQVTVDQRTTLNWHGQVLPVMVVNYRSSKQRTTAPPRARLWVTDEGTVLQQEAQLMGSRITFIRQRSAPPDVEHVSPEEAWDRTRATEPTGM